MASPSQPDLQRELTDAFDAFRGALVQVLEAEAQRSVADAIGRLSPASGPFQVIEADVQVVIRELKFSAAGQGPGAAAGAAPRGRVTEQRSRQPRRGRTARSARGAGRSRGPVGEALLAIFAASDGEMTTDEVQAALLKRGVKTSAGNVYQQLRRLVQAGELTRAGRGRYRRSEAAAAA